jgi:3-hydroxy-3-methylglutaryl CoA synthase/uncharacterized OB-fold protein
MSVGITSWGVYLPTWRLSRRAIAEVLGGPAGRGTRSVASYDEDATTMAVEAGRRALATAGRTGGSAGPRALLCSTPAPPYLDKTNATTVHAALDLDPAAGAYDLNGSVRSGVVAWQAAAAMAAGGEPAMAVVSDLRTGLAGGPEERDSGDGAVALVFGTDGVVAEVVARASATEEFLDRWRTPGELDARVWEERFGEEVYGPLVDAAFADALKQAGVTPGDLDHVVVAGLHARAVRAAKGSLGVRPEALVDDRATTIGNLGAAQAGFGLVDALERAEADQLIAVVVVADGADVVVLRTTAALAAARAARAEAGLADLEALVAAGRDDLPYARFLTWRGELRREPPRRPDPERPGAPATWRVAAWKGGFSASRCEACGFRHLPPTRVCLKCRTVDHMKIERLADVPGTVATFTIDHLAFSLSPPVVGAVVDFEGGGRYRCEMTDVDPATVAIGTPVEMTFRRLYTAQGVHNYFWKAKPATAAPAGDPPAAAAPGEGGSA